MVNNAKQVLLIVGHQYGMYLISVHYLLNFRDLCLRSDGLWGARHDIADRAIEELCLPFLRCPTDITVSNQSCNLSVNLCQVFLCLPG